ncbi:zinc finger BED domain-containing protein RICESLEEPER 2-like protein [Tanacetum coccineum]
MMIFKRRLAKNYEAKLVIYNCFARKEYERIFMCNTAKDIWKNLLITHQDESIDSAFARFNTIITSLKALDEGYSSKNYVRKFLRFVRQHRNDKKTFKEAETTKTAKVKGSALDAEIQIILLENVQSHRETKNQRAFVGGSWSDSGEEDDEKIKTRTCLAQAQMSDAWSISNNLPSPVDIISYVREDREGQVTRIRHQEEVEVMEPSGSEASEARNRDKGKATLIDVDSENGASETKCPYCNMVLAENSKQNDTSTLERCRKAVARMCIKDNQPFSIVEDEGFSELVWELNSEFELPSRWTVARDTLLELTDRDYAHLRCCAHIINLVVRDGLEEQNSSIFKIQRAVKYLRSSSGRLELTEHDYTSYFFNEPEDGEEGTRMMPKTKKKKKNVVGVPNEDDWSNARFFLEYLRIFYDVTNKISGCKYVTSNMFVKDLVTMHAAISKMCRHADENKRKIALSMKAKYDKYWDNLDNMNVLLYVALVLDPRNKLKYLEFCLDLIYPKSRTETSNQGDQVSKRLKTLSAKTIEICKIVEDALKELYVHYKIKLDKHNDETFTLSSSSTPSEDDCSMKIDLDDGFSKYLETQYGEGDDYTEVDVYLKDGAEKRGDNSFDVLERSLVAAPL